MPSGSPDGGDPAPIVIAPGSTELATPSEYGPQPGPWIGEPAAAADLYRREIAAPPRDGVWAAPLMQAMGDLVVAVGGEAAAAARCYQEASVADPLFAAPLGQLRRLLAAQGDWPALVALLDRALQHPALSLADKADLWVERGRILEDRLHRDADAAASYRAALTAPAAAATSSEVTGADTIVDRVPALLALLLLGARTSDGAAMETALAGLTRLARGSQTEATLAVALARTQRAAPVGVDGEGKALRTIIDALASPTAGTDEALLQQLEALTRAGDSRVRAAALGDLARRWGPGDRPALASALLREQGRLFRTELDDPLAAFASLREALALTPGHTLLAGELADIADQLDRGDLLEQVLDLCPEIGDGAPSPLRREIILRHAEVLARQGQPREALALLLVHPDLPVVEPRVAAVETVLLARAGDAAALAARFEDEGERLTGVAGAQAFLRAAAIVEWVLGQGDRAEALMRKAVALAPGYRPATFVLTRKLRAAGRSAELASVLETELASTEPAAPADQARRPVLLESLVGLFRDELRDPARAHAHQRALLAATPQGPQRVRALTRLMDLELLMEARQPAATAPEPVSAAQAETLTALADAAGADDDPLVAALHSQAAWALTGAARSDEDRRRAEALFRRALAGDASDRSAAGLEALLGDPAFRDHRSGQARVVALVAELDAAQARGAHEVARALRFRLSAVQADGGAVDEALATLAPLRAAGEPLACGFSQELARAAGRPDWRARVLEEQSSTSASTTALSQAVELALAEATEAQGHWPDALLRYRQAQHGGNTATMDAALGALRCTAMSAAPVTELAGSFRAAADAAGGDGALAAVLRREGELLAAASGLGAPVFSLAGDLSGAGAAVVATEAIDEALGTWIVAVRGNDPGAVARSLLALARATDDRTGVAPALLARAASRGRLAGNDDAQRLQVAAWRASPDAPALQHGLSDLPAAPPSSPALAGLGTARAARAVTAGGTLGVALDIERAYDAESAGRTAEALQAYGRVLAGDAACIEAIEGVRRLAQAAGDSLGQARALARLAALAKGARAATLFAEGAVLYEQAGKVEEAIALHWSVLRERPTDELAAARLTVLLTAAGDAPGRAADYTRLLAHRLSLLPAEHVERVPLLLARAQHRLGRLGDTVSAIQDFKRILKIVPDHEEALGALSALAITAGAPPHVAGFLERYLAVARDPVRAAQARLDLAAAYETMRDDARAVEILEHAAAVSPTDTRPRERLVALLSRASDWRPALAALRAWEQATSVSSDNARLHVRIGTLLRDQALDQSGAAQSFRLAADLDPLGDGARALVALYESVGDGAGRSRVIAREISDLRQRLAVDPLDVPRLHRLREFLQREASGGALTSAGAALPLATEADDVVRPVVQLLALLGETVEPSEALPPPGSPRAGIVVRAVWERLAVPHSSGFLTEIWSLIAAAVAEMRRPDAATLSRLGVARANRLAPGAEPRLAWIEATAVALGVEGLSCYVSPQALGVAGEGDAGVAVVELPDPVLVCDRAALVGGASARFRFGRALGLLRQRASVLDRLASDELRDIFLAAGALAGVPAPVDPARAAPASVVKALGKALPRKERKSLALLASRFAFGATEVEAWRRALLGSADRLGLVIAGDVAAAARVVAGGRGGPVAASELRASVPAMELLRFALEQVYLDLRAETGSAGG